MNSVPLPVSSGHKRKTPDLSRPLPGQLADEPAGVGSATSARWAALRSFHYNGYNASRPKDLFEEHRAMKKQLDLRKPMMPVREIP